MADKAMTAVAQHGLADLAVGGNKTEARNAALRLEGAADVNEELAEIGLSAKTGWYASILLYGVGGMVTVAAGVWRPDLVPTGVTILGGFAILLALLSIVGARYLMNADWATHMRLGLGLAIFLVGAFVAGDLRQAFVLMPMFVLITPTFIYGRRFAAPYVIVVTAAMFIVLLVTPGPARVAHEVITVGAIAMLVTSFMLAEHSTRALARANRLLAYTDALTGIANTRRLRERLTEALGKPFGAGQPFALFAIDLDNFKLVNDNFDHSTGDRVLKAVAIALDQEVRAEDLVARRGGDEFSVLVANPDGADLDEMSSRFERAIERARKATCPAVTPSGSVAWVQSKPGDTIASVLQRADDELHARKSEFHNSTGGRAAAAAAMAANSNGGATVIRITDRDAAMRSVAAAVNRAFARPSTSGSERFNAIKQRVRRDVANLNPIWSYCGVSVSLGGATIVILTASGLLAPISAVLGIGVGLAMLAVGGFCFEAARRDWSTKFIPVGFAVSIALVTVAVASAGMSGAALIDIYAVFALYAFYFMRPRKASFFLVACSGLYIGFAVGANYPDGGIRAAITVAVLVVCASILTKVQSVTRRFVRTNRELSEVDALTGVANLRALRMRVGSALETASPKSAVRRPMLVTVDLDRFKEVNDNYSHTIGDQVLESVARAISETVRVDELVARRGGDEFFILFSNETSDHVEQVVSRLRDAVEHARLRICPDLVPTASIGFVAWKPHESIDDFMLSADNVMHDEKIETRQNDYGRLHA